MDEVVRVAPVAGEAGLIAFECPNCRYVMSGAARIPPLPADQKARNYVEFIQRSAREMERLVRDLLDLSSLYRTRACAMLLHIGREPGLELAHQRGEAGHDGDRTKQRP
jgi:signal transduction histidine kinase